MSAPIPARRAAVRTPCRRAFNAHLATALAATALLSACAPVTTPLAGTDPADPAAKVAAVTYRPVLVPYTRLHPTTPGPWGEHNDGRAPPATPDRQERDR